MLATQQSLTQNVLRKLYGTILGLLSLDRHKCLFPPYRALMTKYNSNQVQLVEAQAEIIHREW